MAVKAYQTLLQYSAGSGTFASFLNVKSIKPFKVSAKDIDITTLTSPNEFEEVVAGLANGGELEATVLYDATQTGSVYALFRVTQLYRLKYPDNSGWTFSGYVSEIGDEEVQNGEVVKTTLKIKVTGQPTKSPSL